MNLRAMAVLARWLGPWAADRAPRALAVREAALAGIRVRAYEPRRARATLVIAPGMHRTGPDDPRLDRFARILAAAGHRVLSPAIAGHVALTPGRGARADFLRLVDAIEPAAILSISFGSYLALAAAAERPARVRRLIVFGGYGEIAPTLAHALGDPGDHATLALNVLDLPAEVQALVRDFVASPSSIDRDRLSPALRAQLDEATGAAHGATARLRAAIARATALSDELDVAGVCPRVRCPVDIVHGQNDATIPAAQAAALAARLTASPRVRLHVIDDYHHTGFDRGQLARLVAQARTLLGTLAVLSP